MHDPGVHRVSTRVALGCLVAAIAGCLADPPAAREPSPIDTVVVNEVVSKPRGGGVDWVEIYNRSTAVVALGGWGLVDDSVSHAPYLFPQGTSLAPGGFLVVARDDTGAAGFPFGLGDEDAVNLLDPDGKVVDRAAWLSGQNPEGQSFGRLPDGFGDFRTLGVPTPASSNGLVAAP